MIPNKPLRKKLIENAFEKKMGHVGSALSCLDAVNYLYDNIITRDDIFILSKGHGAMALYLALEKQGKKPDWTMHPELDEEKGIYATTGSLGHGEMAEGSVWESLILANRFKLDNLYILIDWNKYGGLTDDVKKLFDFDGDSLAARVRAFGFNVLKIDGHDEKQLESLKALHDARTVVILDTIKGKGVDVLEKTHFHGY